MAGRKRKIDLNAKADKAIARVKVKVASIPRNTQLFTDPAKKLATQAFSIIARMVETEAGLSPHTFLARVKIILTTIPEVPEVVTLENKVFSLEIGRAH